MISISGLCQFFAEVCLYISTIRFAFIFFAEISPPAPVAVFLCVAGIAASFCSRFKGIVPYLPMLLTVPAFFFAGNLASIIALIPLEMLLFMIIRQNGWKGDSVVLRGLLTPGAILIVFMILAASIGDRFPEFKDQALPFFISFLGLVILGLRILRNEDSGRTDAKFYILNIGLVCLVCASGFLFSSKILLAAIKAVAGVIYRFIIAPFFMLFAYVTMMVPLFIGWLLRKVKLKDQMTLQQEIQLVTNDQDMLEAIAETTETSPEWIGTVATILFVLIFLFICFIVIRKIVDNAGGTKLSDVAMTRSETDAEMPEKKRRRIFRSGPADTVRACYRKYLEICRDLMIPTDGTIASDRIADRSEGRTGREETRALRRLWLPARYSEEASTDEDAKQAKLLLKEIKKNSK